MKTKIQFLCALLVSLATMCLISGCASAGGNGAYTLKQTRDDVHWAMVRYQNQVAAGMVTLAEKQQVSAAHDAYQAAFDGAVQQAQSDYNAPTPDNVKQLANQLLSILGSIP